VATTNVNHANILENFNIKQYKTLPTQILMETYSWHASKLMKESKNIFVDEIRPN
jgi:hypothetical protein